METSAKYSKNVTDSFQLFVESIIKFDENNENDKLDYLSEKQ